MRLKVKQTMINKKCYLEDGFTLTELIAGVSIIGILSTMIIGFSMQSVNKAKTAEGKVLINSYLKAIQSYYIENSTYPKSSGDLAQFVNINSCPIPNPRKCKTLPVGPPSNPLFWYTPSGNFKILFRPIYAPRNNTHIWAIPINPLSGLRVISGCYNNESNAAYVSEVLNNSHFYKYHNFC